MRQRLNFLYLFGCIADCVEHSGACQHRTHRNPPEVRRPQRTAANATTDTATNEGTDAAADEGTDAKADEGADAEADEGTDEGADAAADEVADGGTGARRHVSAGA